MSRGPRESLARCTSCAWAGLYAVAVVIEPYAERSRGPRPNACLACADGEVRVALSPHEEREAIRQHLAAALADARALPTEAGAIAVVTGEGAAALRTATIDARALAEHPRLELERVVALLRGAPRPPGSPYR